MEDVVARLERVASQLEAVQARAAAGTPLNNSTAPKAPSTGAAPAPKVAPPTSGSLGAFTTLLNTNLTSVVDSADLIGGEVLRATRLLAEAFTKETDIIAAFTACKQPSDSSALQALLSPVGTLVMNAGDLSSGPRSPYVNHFKFVGEAAQALTWVAYSGPGCGMQLPAQHVEETASAADFYGNKILMEWRAKDPNHVTWVKAIKELLAALKEYCARNFPAGPVWNSAGIDLKDFDGSVPAASTATPPPASNPPASASAPSKKSGAPPPPPPPPPPPGLLEKMASSKAAAPTSAASGGGAPMAALFADINKGNAITSGLRKVTDDMKAKNRPAEERSGTVPAKAISAATGARQTTSSAGGARGPSAAPSTATPRMECEQQRKWVVEHHVGRRDLVIENTEPKQTVYIYGCRESTVQVKGKVNAITLDGCTRCGLVFDTVVSSCEVVNCSNVEVQCTGSAPTVAADKTDGLQLYLPQATLNDTEIVTAKCSEVNVVVMSGTGEDAEPQEWAIPEQFVSKYKKGRLVTEPVAHSGG